MKSIILCEGKTDAILISYFLKKKFDWTHTKNQVVGLPVDNDNEILNWYYHPQKSDSELAIWGVGGIDNIPIKLSDVIDRTRNERNKENRFYRIVIFFDRANLNNGQCNHLVLTWLNNVNLTFVDNPNIGQWTDATIKTTSIPPLDHRIEVLPIVLPPDGEGELETFLLNGLSASSDVDRQLVETAKDFINEIPNDPYLTHNRYRPKACLGAVLSVISPDWVFSNLDDRLMLVEWETLEKVANIYAELSAL